MNLPPGQRFGCYQILPFCVCAEGRLSPQLPLPGHHHLHEAQGLLMPALIFLEPIGYGVKYAAFVYGGICVCMSMQCVSKHIQKYTHGGQEWMQNVFPCHSCIPLLYSGIQSLTEAGAYRLVRLAVHQAPRIVFPGLGSETHTVRFLCRCQVYQDQIANTYPRATSSAPNLQLCSLCSKYYRYPSM